MHRPGSKHAGPTLYTNSLRAWQAQYKARRSVAPTEHAPAAESPASREGAPGGLSADGQTAASEATAR